MREADLGARTRIGGGATSDVERLDTFTVPGYDGGVAYVRMRDAAGADDALRLARLIAWRDGLDPRERAALDGVAAWPLAAVTDDDGATVGCLVPLAAHPFYYVPAGERETSKAPQSAKWLVVAPKRARRVGAEAVAERDLVARCTVLARMCLLLDLLHRHGIVYGDLSDRAVLFGAGEVPSAFVVGCEGAVFADSAGRGTIAQRNSVGWVAPETAAPEVESGGHPDAVLKAAPSVQSAETDRHKLGLLILRVLAPAGDGLERSRDAARLRGVLDDTGERMLQRALGEAPGERPSAADWYTYLRGVIVQNLEAPVIRSVVVSPALVAEGDEVWLDVELAGAQQLTIELPGRADITREVRGRTVSERFTARQSGRIRVRAANAHGDTVALSNTVRVLPVPTPAQVVVAAPEIPGLLGVIPDIAALQTGLAIATADRLAAPPAPAVASPPPAEEADARADRASRSRSPRRSAPAQQPPVPVTSPYDAVAALRERIEADAVPLNDILRLGVEAERASREQLLPSFSEVLAVVRAPRSRRTGTGIDAGAEPAEDD